MKSFTTTLAGLVLLAAGVFALPACAGSLAGTKTVSLVTPAGDKVVIGQVVIEAKSGGYAFGLTFKHDAFKEVYMRENNVLCREATGKEICHFTYPPAEYAPDDSSGTFNEGDLRPLEYALLFVEKRPAPAEVDINPFNGLYYKLNVVGDHIEGSVYGADLTSTYTDGAAGKYIIERLDEVDLASQRFPRPLIE